MSDTNEREVMKLDAARGKKLFTQTGEFQDFERFLLFMSALSDPKTFCNDSRKLVTAFALLTGWDEPRAQAAFDACVIKGYIGKTP